MTDEVESIYQEEEVDEQETEEFVEVEEETYGLFNDQF